MRKLSSINLVRWARRVGRPTVRPPPPLTSSYFDEFRASAEGCLAFLNRCDLPPISEQGDPLGILIAPWVATAVPWFSMALAVGLLRYGRRPILIWDDNPFEPDSEFVRAQTVEIERVLLRLRTALRVIPLREFAPAPLDASDRDELERLAHLNLTWHLRAAAPGLAEYQLLNDFRERLAHTLSQTKSLLSCIPFRYLVLPGGIYRSSGVMRYAAERQGLRASTYDSGFGVVQIATEGIAAQQADVPRTFHELSKLPPAARAELIRLARAEFRQRSEARDNAQYQIVPSTGQRPSLSGDVLIPPNVEWDAAALNRHHIFENSRAWLVDAISYILDHSTADIVVRQHPAERDKYGNSRFGLIELLEEHFGANLRVRLVRAQDPISTYDLIRSASLVLPFVSTIGIEAAAMGKVVLVAGQSYYSNLGFVHTATTREEYLGKLSQALLGELGLLPEQVDKAWLCYYITPLCNRVWTHFTPTMQDFQTWSRIAPADLFGEPAVQQILTALDENIPLSLVRHRAGLPVAGEPEKA